MPISLKYPYRLHSFSTVECRDIFDYSAYLAGAAGRRACVDDVVVGGSLVVMPQTLADVGASMSAGGGGGGRDGLSAAEQYVQFARSSSDDVVDPCFDYSYPQLDAVAPAAPYPVPSRTAAFAAVDAPRLKTDLVCNGRPVTWVYVPRC